jgi:hypothetical protein
VKHSAYCREYGPGSDLFCNGCSHELTPQASADRLYGSFILLCVLLIGALLITFFTRAGYVGNNGGTDGVVIRFMAGTNA